jgi:hypothetical protein
VLRCQGRIVETFFQDQKVVPTAKLYSKVCRWLGPGSSIYIASQLQILKIHGTLLLRLAVAMCNASILRASFCQMKLEINFLHRFVHSGLCKTITQYIFIEIVESPQWMTDLLVLHSTNEG